MYLIHNGGVNTTGGQQPAHLSRSSQAPVATHRLGMLQRVNNQQEPTSKDMRRW